MISTVRLILLLEVASFATAASIHFGALLHGYAHLKAAVAESVIACILLAGLGAIWIRPASVLQAGLIAQGLALAGTVVGAYTILIGVGPRTKPDIAYHIVILAVLVCGLLVTRQAVGAGALLPGGPQ